MTDDHITSSVAQRFKDLDTKLEQISGQIAEMKGQMVTRKEYNDAYGPLLKMVNDHEPMVKSHERAYRSTLKGLMWLGAATLVSAIVSPHWSAVAKGIMEWFK